MPVDPTPEALARDPEVEEAWAEKRMADASYEASLFTGLRLDASRERVVAANQSLTSAIAARACAPWKELARRCSVAIINGELRPFANIEKMDRLSVDLIETLAAHREATK